MSLITKYVNKKTKQKSIVHLYDERLFSKFQFQKQWPWLRNKKGIIIYRNRYICETMGTFHRNVIPQRFFDTFNMAVQM